MLLSVIITTFNEKLTILEIIKRVRSIELPFNCKKEIIIVDNLSTDGTKDILNRIKDDKDITVVHQKVNLGKSASVRTAIPMCKGDYIISQDADLEYNPKDIIPLLRKLITEDYDVVIGSRALNKKGYHAYAINEFGINFLNFITNLLFGSKYSDVATCYKLIRAELLKSLKLKSNGFNLDFELCAKFAKNKWTVGEVLIDYNCRTVEEGRKTSNPYYHGFSALKVILHERIITY